MKKLMKLMMGIAVAAISFTGCENNFDNVQPEQKGFELTVVADNVSRTEYDADLVDIKWSTGDMAQVIVKGSYHNATAEIDADDPRIASFTWAPAAQYRQNVTAGVWTVQGYAPKGAYAHCLYNSTEAAEKTHATRLGLKLPASQSATTATFDGAADILVADNMAVEITEEDLDAGSKTVGNFKFRRMVAVSEFTYKVTNSELTASDEKVTSVSFEVVSEGKYLAGNMYVQPNADGAKYVDADLNEITDSKDVFYQNDANKVTVTLTDKPALKNGFKAWFVTTPVTLAVGDQLVFTVTTENGTTITKTVNVTNEVAFSTEMKNKLAVNLNNDVEIVVPEVPEVPETEYVLMAKYNNKFYALSSQDASSTNRRTAIVINNYNAGDATVTINDEKLIWTVSETTGGYYIMQDGKYLYGTDAENYANVGETKDVISMVGQGDGTYKMISSNNTTEERILALNGNVNGNQEFSFYKTSTTTGTSSSNYADDIYMVPVNFVPTPELTVVAQPGEVGAVGATVTVDLDGKNLTEGISVTCDETWITDASVSGTKLTFTVAENEKEEKRNATLIVTSSGCTAEVYVVQSAKIAAGVTTTTTIDFTKLYSADTDVNGKSHAADGVVVKFDKKTSSTAPKYYANGTSVRLYTNSTMTVTAPEGKIITSIVVSAQKNNSGTTFKANTGTFNESYSTTSFSNGTWTGNSNSVVFTVGGTKHMRIKSVTVTFQ